MTTNRPISPINRVVEGKSDGIVELSNNLTVDHKHGCQNRDRSALRSPYIAPNGFKEDGSKRFRTVRTDWIEGDSGRCQYAKTAEGQGDPGCVECIWRVGE